MILDRSETASAKTAAVIEPVYVNTLKFVAAITSPSDAERQPPHSSKKQKTCFRKTFVYL
jgi:hypothetical protein